MEITWITDLKLTNVTASRPQLTVHNYSMRVDSKQRCRPDTNRGCAAAVASPAPLPGSRASRWGLHPATALSTRQTGRLSDSKHAGTRWYTAVHSDTRRYTAVHCGARRYTVVHCGTRRYTVVHCGALWCTAVHCGTRRYTTVHGDTRRCTAKCNSSDQVMYPLSNCSCHFLVWCLALIGLGKYWLVLCKDNATEWDIGSWFKSLDFPVEQQYNATVSTHCHKWLLMFPGRKPSTINNLCTYMYVYIHIHIYTYKHLYIKTVQWGKHAGYIEFEIHLF